MREIPQRQILARIALENPWWQSPHEVPTHFAEVPPRPYIKLFYPLVATSNVRRAPILMGPRRVGKTFLLHHCIAKLLQEGVEPKRIFYITLDHPTLVGQSLESLLALYEEATGRSLLADNAEAPTFIFFDEIQYLRHWEQHLKSLVDTFPQTRFTASGSAAAALKLKAQESGAGRFSDFLLPPLTFYEYLELFGLGDELVYSTVSDDAAIYAELDLPHLTDKFTDYIKFGGYPEAALSPEIQANPERFIKSDIIEKVLLRDIPQMYGIHNVQELNALFTSLAFNTAQECSLEELSRRSGVTGPTIKRYIEYLEAAFLIKVIYRVDRTARHFKRQRTFKVYLTNPALWTALFGSLSPKDADYGHLVETAIYAQWFHYENQALHYGRWPKGELDLISLGPGDRWAVEVKWSDRVANNRALLKQPVEFCADNRIGKLAVTTKTKNRTEVINGVAVSFWPAALYAYAVGHSIINYRVRALEAQTASSI